MTIQRPARAYDTDDLRAFVQSGATLADIAAELDTNKGAIRRALGRRDMRATRAECQTLRQRVQTMRAPDAVEFLLDCFEVLAGSMAGADDHPVDAWGIRLTPTERRMLICLHDAGGGLRNKNSLLDAMTFDRPGDGPSIKSVDVYICKLRRKLPARVGRIETVHWHGYRFVAAGA